MRWDPLFELRVLRERRGRAISHHGTGWSPSADLVETGEAFTLIVEIPGLRLDDIEVTATRDALALRGERRPPEGPATYVRLERDYGAFTREFRLSCAVRVDAVSADLRDGLLTVTLPKEAVNDAGRVEID